MTIYYNYFPVFHISPGHVDAHVEALDQLHRLRCRGHRGQHRLAATGQGGEQLGLQSTWAKDRKHGKTIEKSPRNIQEIWST